MVGDEVGSRHSRLHRLHRSGWLRHRCGPAWGQGTCLGPCSHSYCQVIHNPWDLGSVLPREALGVLATHDTYVVLIGTTFRGCQQLYLQQLAPQAWQPGAAGKP